MDVVVIIAPQNYILLVAEPEELRMFSFLNKVLPAIVGMVFLLPQVASGQEGDAADNKARDDLLLLKAKAAQTESLRNSIDQIADMARGGGQFSDDGQLRMFVLGNLASVDMPITLPVDVALIVRVPAASRRGQLLGSILAADLDEDWSISKPELKVAIQADRNNEMAELFVLGDANEDQVLSFDEIKSVIAARSEGGMNVRSRRGNLSILDLDSDGTLTDEEMDRVVNALKFGRCTNQCP